MIQVSIEIYGPFADLAGVNKAVLELEDATVRGLIAEMKRRWNRSFIEAVMDEEGKEFGLAVLVLVNSQPVYHLEGMDTILAQGDKIVLLPPMAGGYHLPPV
ncbi:MAG: MoaD/ThiS family protein [Dehalococcoidia bacterium]|nr:MoaD/ThiS family protein [Dehalococcoidia bacterium]MDZ4247031.1 MoaD/ThiS family protein [Dehalococcoidia bacterium]